MKKGYSVNLEKETQNNEDFRRVLYTGEHSQLVLMCLQPGGDIGEEVHAHLDQFFRFESGEGIVLVNEAEYKVADGSCAIVPAGANHNVTNTSKTEKLKFYTIYSPPEHIDKTIRHAKADALAEPEEYDGKPTE
ncbi:MAG: cupin domain-containing protein [Candidatus Micrarchaeota archaeon]